MHDPSLRPSAPPPPRPAPAPRRPAAPRAGGALRALAAAAVLAGCGGGPAEEPKRHPAAHVVRLTAALEFDGRPVRFDELIDCRATYTGTPTSSPHMTFEPSRWWLPAEVAGGGMIVARFSREICFLDGDTWGSVWPEKTAPEGWTPRLAWYDHRDPRQATEGIVYLSETALEAPRGRLRITEPFRVAIPEHPPSDTLIAEAARQEIERALWPGEPPSVSESSSFHSYGVMAWMLPIREAEWRNPERARRSHSINRGIPNPTPDYAALARVLDAQPGTGLRNIGYRSKLGDEDAAAVLSGLRDGRFPDLNDLYIFGIPKSDATRHGLLISEKRYREKLERDPFYPDRYDDYVPFICIDGVMTAVPGTPGLRYWFRDRCSHPEHNRGVVVAGQRIEDGIQTFDQILFDPATGTLWWVNR